MDERDRVQARDARQLLGYFAMIFIKMGLLRQNSFTPSSGWYYGHAA